MKWYFMCILIGILLYILLNQINHFRVWAVLKPSISGNSKGLSGPDDYNYYFNADYDNDGDVPIPNAIIINEPNFPTGIPNDNIEYTPVNRGPWHNHQVNFRRYPPTDQGGVIPGIDLPHLQPPESQWAIGYMGPGGQGGQGGSTESGIWQIMSSLIGNRLNKCASGFRCCSLDTLQYASIGEVLDESYEVLDEPEIKPVCIDDLEENIIPLILSQSTPESILSLMETCTQYRDIIQNYINEIFESYHLTESEMNFILTNIFDTFNSGMTGLIPYSITYNRLIRRQITEAMYNSLYRSQIEIYNSYIDTINLLTDRDSFTLGINLIGIGENLNSLNDSPIKLVLIKSDGRYKLLVLTDNNGYKLSKNEFTLYSKQMLDVTDNIGDVLQLLKDINYMFSSDTFSSDTLPELSNNMVHNLSKEIRGDLKNRLLHFGIDIENKFMYYLTSNIAFNMES